MNDMELPKIIIDPVGPKDGDIRRYDIYAEGVEGAYLGHTQSYAQAEAWKDGIVRLMNHIIKINGFNRH